MRAAVAVLLASAIMPAGVAFATTILAMKQLFPTERPPILSGRVVAIKVGPAVTDDLKITPVTFLSKPGTNTGEGSKSMCGLVIKSRGNQMQGVITVGIGVTEATPSCDAILAIGAVPALRGEPIRRLGVIHAVSSQNAADGRAAVVLRRVAGRWEVDDAATTRADTLSHYSIAELRRIL